MDFGRIVFGIFFFGFLAAYDAWRWKRAGFVSEAMAAERRAARQSFESLKQDPGFTRSTSISIPSTAPPSMARRTQRRTAFATWG